MIIIIIILVDLVHKLSIVVIQLSHTIMSTVSIQSKPRAPLAIATVTTRDVSFHVVVRETLVSFRGINHRSSREKICELIVELSFVNRLVL